MTIEEAIELLRYNSRVIHITKDGRSDPREVKALDMAIEALEHQKDISVKCKSRRKFEEIVVEYLPANLCIYPEYRGEPYFSIKYEENGEHFIGFGTYKPEVLSSYLKEYFIEADTESEDI